MPDNPETDFKQVIVLRKDLNMRKGKMVAQGAHASMAVFTRGPGTSFVAGVSGLEMRVVLDEASAAWLTGRFRKICVSADSEAQLLELHRQALAAGLPCALIQDSGITEFGGVPTYTALAIGPGSNEKLDPITSSLRLL
ncbi:aminoacyl-tRNA hydrolase [Aquabacterium sp. A7-Y]|uniref:aminoacyl-tRNA hydrolase n=1 Tax=Aquabacterium sp. A7-Y TaxID=1349605 RepID=UPI00223D20A4|nr:aminoacyl-tRNA hydrolase [Aquabacterium sp. A7-Y]MCW7539126.1 aminoacyl-tRNA hydrolase [Aquabacterium sp. A7-Y]